MARRMTQNVKTPDILLAMGGSTVRMRVLLFLAKADDEESAMEIADKTGICYSHVRGSLVGARGRWSMVKSLVSMGMVKARQVTASLTVYSLTDEGRKFIASTKFEKASL